MKVFELMTSDVANVRPDESLERVASLMMDRNCGCIAVVGDNFEIVGIVTDRDVCMAALRTGDSLAHVGVDTIMSRCVFSCRADDSIAAAEEQMGLHQVRRLPVIDENGRLQGILSIDDIADEAHREDDLFATKVSVAEVGRTLGQIRRPHLIDDV